MYLYPLQQSLVILLCKELQVLSAVVQDVAQAVLQVCLQGRALLNRQGVLSKYSLESASLCTVACFPALLVVRDHLAHYGEMLGMCRPV